MHRNNLGTKTSADDDDCDWEPIRISNRFRKEKEFSELESSLNSCTNNMERVKVFRAFPNFPKPPEFKSKHRKDAEISSKMIETAKANFKAGNYEKALRGYVQAILYAPSNSVSMVLAFLRRAEFFIYTKEWEFALLDINAALECDPSALKEKCEEIKSYIEENIREERESRERLEQMNLNAENLGLWKDYVEKELFKIGNPNSKIPSAANFVEIQTDREKGRKLVTTSDIPIGAVVVVEKPFAKLRKSGLTVDTERDQCHFCLTTSKRLISCPGCVFVLYCNEKCLEAAYKEYHHFECPCLPNLHDLKVSSGFGLVFRLLCIVGPEELYAIFCGSNPKFKEENIPSTYIKGCDPDSGMYDSNSYLQMYHLHSRRSSLFKWTEFPIVMSCVLLVHLLDKKTDFFDKIEYNEKFPRLDFVDFTVAIAVRNIDSLSRNAFALKCMKTAFKDALRPTQETLRNTRFSTHAVGVFSVGSLFNHSCTPNVIRVNDCSGKLAFVTVKPLKAGEELFISYVPHFYDYPLRKRAAAFKVYEFKCKCEACVGDWPLLKTLDYLDPELCCTNCANDFPVSGRSNPAFEKCKLRITVKLTRCGRCKIPYNTQNILDRINKRSEEIIKAKHLILSRQPLEAITILKENLNFFHSTACEPFVLICQATTWYHIALDFIINFVT